MKKQLLISIAILFFLFVATTLVILYGKGYRLWFDKGKPDISGTGLLVATSQPDGAQVFINNNLITATDSTINLPPGEYTVKIYKEGYSPWEKKLIIQKEIVVKADATLFSTAPKLESITTIGVENPILSPSLSKIAYNVASQSAKKNGVYVLDLNTRPLLTLQGASTQVVDDTINEFSTSALTWSPDGKEMIASISAASIYPTTYLLSSSSFNDSLKNITTTLDTILDTWEKEKTEKETARIENLKPALKKTINESFSQAMWSADETKILYTASNSATIPAIIQPALIGTNQTSETRTLEKGATYVYDMKEDKNYKIEIGNSKWPRPLSWFPDSKHLIYVHDKKIDIVEYDGTNKITVYAGPFDEKYVFPYTNGSRIVILTNLGNPDISPNLYTLGLQ